MTVFKAALLLPLAAAALSPAADEAEKARAALENYLGKAGAGAGRVLPVADVPADALPGQRVYAVRFRDYPVKPPVSFRATNLFAVAANGDVKRLPDEKSVKEFLSAALPPVTGDTGAKAAVKTWLRLMGELHQDGYYTYKIADESVTTSARDGKRIASGTAKVSAGGEGQITATLAFDGSGRLAATTTEASVKPSGDRPAGGRP